VLVTDRARQATLSIPAEHLRQKTENVFQEAVLAAALLGARDDEVRVASAASNPEVSAPTTRRRRAGKTT
jgi:hypothetical protein